MLPNISKESCGGALLYSPRFPRSLSLPPRGPSNTTLEKLAFARGIWAADLRPGNTSLNWTIPPFVTAKIGSFAGNQCKLDYNNLSLFTFKYDKMTCVISETLSYRVSLISSIFLDLIGLRVEWQNKLNTYSMQRKAQNSYTQRIGVSKETVGI